MEIRVLAPGDNRSSFACGDADLDRFLVKYAGQNQFKHHIGTTYVAVEAEVILGYATVTVGHIEVESLPQDLARRLPRYPLPIVRLARLAVDQSAQGKGIGGALLYVVLRLALEQADQVGCVGVVVDARPGAESWYERYGFVSMPVIDGGSSARPRPTPMFLGLQTIQAATRADRQVTRLRS